MGGALIGLQALSEGVNRMLAGNRERRDEAREDERFDLNKQQTLLQMKQIGLAIEQSEYRMAVDRAQGTPGEIAERAHEDRMREIEAHTQKMDLARKAHDLDVEALGIQKFRANTDRARATNQGKEGSDPAVILKNLEGQVKGSEKAIDLLDEQIDRLRANNSGGNLDEEIERLSVQRQETFERLQDEQTRLREAQRRASELGPEPKPFEPQGPPVLEPEPESGGFNLMDHLSPSGAAAGAGNLFGMATGALNSLFSGENRGSFPFIDTPKAPNNTGPGPMVDINNGTQFIGPPAPPQQPVGQFRTIPPNMPINFGAPMGPPAPPVPPTPQGQVTIEQLRALLGG